MSQHEQVRAWDKYYEREKSKHVINGSMVYAATAFFCHVYVLSAWQVATYPFHEYAHSKLGCP